MLDDRHPGVEAWLKPQKRAGGGSINGAQKEGCLWDGDGDGYVGTSLARKNYVDGRGKGIMSSKGKDGRRHYYGKPTPENLEKCCACLKTILSCYAEEAPDTCATADVAGLRDTVLNAHQSKFQILTRTWMGGPQVVYGYDQFQWNKCPFAHLLAPAGTKVDDQGAHMVAIPTFATTETVAPQA